MRKACKERRQSDAEAKGRQKEGEMVKERKREDYLRPVPGEKGVYRYIPQEESPSFDKILERISTPVVIERDSDRESKE